MDQLGRDFLAPISLSLLSSNLKFGVLRFIKGKTIHRFWPCSSFDDGVLNMQHETNSLSLETLVLNSNLSPSLPRIRSHMSRLPFASTSLRWDSAVVGGESYFPIPWCYNVSTIAKRSKLPLILILVLFCFDGDLSGSSIDMNIELCHYRRYDRGFF